MTGKTSGDSSPGVSGNIFGGIHDSFTTQGLARMAGIAILSRASPAGRTRKKIPPGTRPTPGAKPSWNSAAFVRGNGAGEHMQPSRA
jgi:hypothetical protein